MPMYTFDCADCSEELEVVTPYDDRDQARMHHETDEDSDCGGALTRRGVEPFKLGAEPYQMKAILNDGTHVKGHFGKTAKPKKRKD